MFDTVQNYPHYSLHSNYVPKLNEGIVAGMAVALDSNGQVVKASGAPNEYAMVATMDQATGFLENGNSVNCLKENATFWTTMYLPDTYTPHLRLQIDGTSKGYFKPYASNNVTGRFVRYEIRDNVQGIVVDLVRS